jgi:hypothetical protein
LVVNLNSFGGAHSVLLTGTGFTGPAVSLSNSELDFASTPVGSSEGGIAIDVVNTGGSELTFGAVTISGDFTETNNCTSLTTNASCHIVVTFKPTAGGTRTGTLTVNDNAPDSPQKIALSGMGGDFSISSTKPSQSVSPGQSAAYALSVAPVGGFSQAISLACSGAPQTSICTVTPSSVTPSGSSAVNATVNVTTVAPSAGGMPRLNPPGFGHRLPGIPAAMLLLLALGLAARCRRARTWAGPVLLAAILLVSCGGGSSSGGGGQSNPGTPAGTYKITITGTSGSGTSELQNTATLTLIVN